MSSTPLLPRPIAVLVMAVLLLMMPVGFYVGIRIGTQPFLEFLTRQLGGTAALVLPRSFINLLAAVGGLGGVVADFNVVFDR